MLDPMTTAAAALLAPYVAKVGEEVAQKAGDAAWQMAASLYQAIRRKFTKDQDAYAQQTLQRLEEQPTNEARQAALADVLNEKVQADPSFAQELKRLVQETTQTQGINQFLTQVYGQAQVEKLVNIGQTGTAQF
jgi:predicted membrane chloride channel (bestrophin family)